MDVIFTGSGEFGVVTLLALGENGHRVVQVVSQPDRPAGRGRGLTPTPVSAFALEHGLPLLRTADINAQTLPRADAMVVIAFGQKIADPIVNHPRLGSMNLHASLLPKYRGAAPINWAIINGDAFAGNSVIRLARRMDAGALLAQDSIAVAPAQTAGELHDLLARRGAGLILHVLGQVENGIAVETPQDESLATLAPKLSRASARLDFNQPAEVIARSICGLYPWPGCRVALCDATGTELARLRLVRAVVGPTDGPRWEPGEIMVDGLIQTAVGGVRILELQPDGRNVMTMADYQRGHRWLPGARLKPIDN